MVKIYNSNFHQCTDSAFQNLGKKTQNALRTAETHPGLCDKLYKIPIRNEQGETTDIYVMLPTEPNLPNCERVSLREVYDIAHHIEDDLHQKIDGNDVHQIFEPILSTEMKKYRGLRGALSKLVSKIKNVFRKEHRFASSAELAEEFMNAHPEHRVGRLERTFQLTKETLGDEITGFTETIYKQECIRFMEKYMGSQTEDEYKTFFYLLPEQFAIKFDPKTNQGLIILDSPKRERLDKLLLGLSGEFLFPELIGIKIEGKRIIFDSNSIQIVKGDLTSPVGRTFLKELDFSNTWVRFLGEIQLGPIKLKGTEVSVNID